MPTAVNGHEPHHNASAAAADTTPSTTTDEPDIIFDYIPQDYLNLYPFPAFVLITGGSGGDDNDYSSTLPWTPSLDSHPFAPVWENERWTQLAQGRTVMDCLAWDGLRRLGLWLSGFKDPHARELSLASCKPGLTSRQRSFDAPFPTITEGLEESFDRPPLDHEEADDSPTTLTLDFDFGNERVSLQLCKTTIPGRRDDDVNQKGPFVIITTTPTPDVEVHGPGSARRSSERSSVSFPTQSTAKSIASVVPGASAVSDLAEKFASFKMSLGTDTARMRKHRIPSMALFDHFEVLDNIEQWQVGQPLYVSDSGIFHQAVPPRLSFADSRPWDVQRLLKETDWSQTSLGPRSRWDWRLESMIKFVMLYPLSGALWWGKDMTFLYNQRYAFNEPEHPMAFGRPGCTSSDEHWAALGPLSEVVLHGTSVVKQDGLIWESPPGSLKSYESYRSQVWCPIMDDDGDLAGVFLGLYHTTARVLAERRAALVHEIGERAAFGRTRKDFDSAVLKTFEGNPKDVPFALLFHLDDSGASFEIPTLTLSAELSSHANSAFPAGTPSVLRLRYAGGVGVPEGHSSAPAVSDIKMSHDVVASEAMLAQAFTALEKSPTPSTDDADYTVSRSSSIDNVTEPSSSCIWPFEEVLRTKKAVLLHDCREIIKGYPVRIWDELPTSAMVMPVTTNSDQGPPGAIVVVGLSSRLSFDGDYEAFLRMMRVQMGSSFNSIRATIAAHKRFDDLAAMDRAKNLLFSSVSNELFTPLGLIAGPLDDVLADMESGPKRRLLKLARRSVDRFSRLVAMLMDLSSLEAGHMKGRFAPVNLGEVTKRIASMFRKSTDNARLKFVVECDTRYMEVFIDREKYEKILFTLIGNALRFTKSGTVTVSLKYTDDDAVITVRDTGVGIAAKDVAAFDEQYLMGSPFSHVHGGTGIALSIARKLVTLHCGTMAMESKTKEESRDGTHGSTFTFTIPLGSDHLSPEAIDSHDISNSPWQSYASPMSELSQSSLELAGPIAEDGVWDATRLPQPRHGIDPSTLFFKPSDVVMLVDDLADSRHYMRAIFEPYCKVVEARDAQEALDKFKTSLPDLVIADSLLPTANGLEFLDALRMGTKEQQTVPVILLTAMHDTRTGRAFVADEFLAKPFNARELIARAHMQLLLGKKRRAMEAAFDERTNEMRILTDFAPVGIFRCSLEGYVTYANPAWYEITEYPPNLPVTNWGDYLVEEQKPIVRKKWESFINDPSQKRAHAEFCWQNGRWVSMTALRIDGAAMQGASGIIGCTIDITQRKLNESLNRQRVQDAELRRAAAEEARQQQELLIDITSHEIRNPISSLMQCASLVKTNLLTLQEKLQAAMETQEGFVPTKQVLSTVNEDLEALDSIYQCGLTQERISNDVLSLGKIQLGRLQMLDVETNIRSEIHKLVSVFQNEARMSRVALKVSYGSGFKRLGVDHIMTDPVRLGQVITNLLSNAIRFTANSVERTVELKLDVSAQAPDDGTCAIPAPSSPLEDDAIGNDQPIYLYIAVSDTGPGLTPPELAILFERFSQASPKTHTVFGGSGLGLFVCRKITERMGGQIDVTSEYGHGSEFRFFVETRRCPPPVAEPTTARRPSHPGSQKPNILVVEDNHINRTVLMRQLKHVGLTAEAVVNGVEALERLQQTQTGAPDVDPFDCVLMDLEMPLMDGYTAVRKLREAEKAGELVPSKVIALTGNARQAQLSDGMADFDRTVVKPYRLDDLLRKIEDVIKESDTNAREGGTNDA